MNLTFFALSFAVLLLANVALAQTELQETEANGIKVQTLTHNVESIKSIVSVEKETPQDKILKAMGCDEDHQSNVRLWDTTVPSNVTVQSHTITLDQSAQK